MKHCKGIVFLVLLILQIPCYLADAKQISKDIGATLQQNQGHEEAYVTLIYSDEWTLPVRVLGHSLRKSGTTRDLVVIVAGEISDHNLATLAADGWRIYRTEAIQNPSLWTQNGGHGFPQRFWGVYTKLMIFNLTQYKRLVYLDADTVAARNIDELFLCDAALCGVLRHSERFNSGVMVLTPSEQTLKDMLHLIATTPSYTGGDQGFLNEYFNEFANSPLFDPSTSGGNPLSRTFVAASVWKDAKGRMLARLPTIYNADLGLYVANSNRWMLPRDQIGVIHFTLVTFKPWQWYSNWILSENGQYWQDLRGELPVYGREYTTRASRRQGKEGEEDNFSSKPLQQGQSGPGPFIFHVFSFLGPFLLSILMVRRWCWKQGLENSLKCWFRCGIRSNKNTTSSAHSNDLNLKLDDAQHHHRLSSLKAAASPTPFLGFKVVSALAGFASLGCALYIAVLIVIPVQIEPWSGWILAYEWISFLTLTFFGSYLWVCYTYGQRRRIIQGSGSGNISPGGSTISAASMAASLALSSTAKSPSLSPRYFTMYSSKKEDGEVLFVCGRRPWGESLIAIGVLLGTLGVLPWWTDIVGVTSFIGKVIGTAACAAVSTAIATQCFITLAQIWFLSGTLETIACPSSLIGASVLPILSIGKD